MVQTYTDIEIICVDDGSTDGSGNIADKFANKDTRFKVIHKPNGGLPSARKAGLEIATGDYIFHLDGDDNLPIGAIEALVRTAEQTDEPDIVIGDYWLQELDNEPKYFSSRINHSMSGHEYVDFILKQGLFNIWGKFYSRRLYTLNDIQIPLEISIGEDLVAVTQLAFHAVTVVPCHEAVYNYYVRPTSMSLVEKAVIGQLNDRAIYAVLFLARFLLDSNYKRRPLVINYIRRFVYEYLRSPYDVRMRWSELNELCGFYCNSLKAVNVRSFSEATTYVACHNLNLAKAMAKLRNWIL